VKRLKAAAVGFGGGGKSNGSLAKAVTAAGCNEGNRRRDTNIMAAGNSAFDAESCNASS